MQLHRFLGVQVNIFEAFKKTVDKSLANFRPLFDRGALTGDRNTEILHSVIFVQNAVQLLALGPYARRDAAEEIPFRLHLFFDQ